MFCPYFETMLQIANTVCKPMHHHLQKRFTDWLKAPPKGALANGLAEIPLLPLTCSPGKQSKWWGKDQIRRKSKCSPFNFIAAITNREVQMKLDSVLLDLGILYLATQIASLKCIWLQKYFIIAHKSFIPCCFSAWESQMHTPRITSG